SRNLLSGLCDTGTAGNCTGAFPSASRAMFTWGSDKSRIILDNYTPGAEHANEYSVSGVFATTCCGGKGLIRLQTLEKAFQGCLPLFGRVVTALGDYRADALNQLLSDVVIVCRLFPRDRLRLARTESEPPASRAGDGAA